jgi:hypothetical protein
MQRYIHENIHSLYFAAMLKEDDFLLIHNLQEIKRVDQEYDPAAQLFLPSF